MKTESNEQLTSPEGGAGTDGLVVTDRNEVIESEEHLRIKCAECCLEIGFTGKREHAASLLEKNGWRLGAQMLCPKCVDKKARKYVRRYASNED